MRYVNDHPRRRTYFTCSVELPRISHDQQRQRITIFNPLLGFLTLLNLSNTLSHCCCSCCVSLGEDCGGASITGAFRPSLRQLPLVKRADTARESHSRQECHQTPSSGNIQDRIRRGGANCEALIHNFSACTVVQGLKGMPYSM